MAGFFHLVEPGDEGFFHAHGFRPGVAHDEQNESVLAHVTYMGISLFCSER